MSAKGSATRQSIVARGFELAGQLGLEGLTIGQLAEQLELSKSGLYAHFKSKEALQIGVVEHAVAQFVDRVVRPSLLTPRGEPRVRAMFAAWLDWGLGQPSGCFFMASTFELDDRPGPVRDALAASQRDWVETLATAARIAQREGHFRPDLDTEAFAFSEYGIVLATAHHHRLLAHPRARALALSSFDDLVAAARARHA